MNRTLTIVVAVILLIAGFATDGLWPWQLPACMLGGLMLTVAINKKPR